MPTWFCILRAEVTDQIPEASILKYGEQQRWKWCQVQLLKYYSIASKSTSIKIKLVFHIKSTQNIIYFLKINAKK